MGCMAGKLPSCLEVPSSNNELIEPISKLQDCYKNLICTFKIRENLAPRIVHDRVSISPLPVTPSELLNKDFPIFQHTDDSLVACAIEIFSQFSLDPVKLASFLDLISKNYFAYIPYHNFKHGFSVFQLIYVISERNNKFYDFLSNQDYLFLLLAGIGHDICHPGINSAYLIGTKNSLAEQYNNVSVLENHHASVTLELLKSSALLQDMNESYWKEVIVHTILSTDMARHKVVFGDFEGVKGNYDKSQKFHRVSFMGYALHCTDLGNPTLDFPLAAIWSFKILQEFNNQVAYEEKAGITVSEFMRIGNDLEKIKKSQVTLIDFIVFPLWKGLSELVKNIEDIPEAIQKNKGLWQELTDIALILSNK
jgi:hypothetical protein